MEPVEWGDEFVLAKLSDDLWEVNIRAQRSEFLTLRDIRTMDWNSRRAAEAGVSAGADVFWCSDGHVATIVVGHDEETWDLAVSVPVGIVDDLVRQVGNL
ncbi:MAG TPA: hypothetical protein VFY84_18815 [Jiangellales bacterium]|nr:hypothetical protein [Jiangellales bacterium]